MTETQTSLLQLDLVAKPKKAARVKKATADERARIAGDPSAFTVPFGRVRVATDNVRADDRTDIAELAESIRHVGLLTPITVRPINPDDLADGFVVETGRRRWNALHALGLTADDPIPVHIVSAAPMADRIQRQWTENEQRRGLTPMDTARSLRRLVEHEELSITDAAARLGLSRSVASKRLDLLQLDATGQAMVDEGRWDIETAQTVGRMIKRGWSGPSLIGAGHWKVEEAQRKWKTGQRLESIRANLEARGYRILRDARSGPAPDGHRTEQGQRLTDLETVKGIKATDPAKVDTVRDDNDTPIVVVQSTDWSEDIIVRSVIVVPLGGSPTDRHETFDPDHLTWNQLGATRETLDAVRARSIVDNIDLIPTIDQDLAARCVLAELAERMYNVDLTVLAEIGGVDVVRNDDGDRVDRSATALAWANERGLTADVAQAMMITAVALWGAHQIGEHDDPNDLVALAAEIADTAPESVPYNHRRLIGYTADQWKSKPAAQLAVELGARPPVQGQAFVEAARRVYDKTNGADDV